MARSGVYHRAANLGDASDRAPPRGSVNPGEYFLYTQLGPSRARRHLREALGAGSLSGVRGRHRGHPWACRTGTWGCKRCATTPGNRRIPPNTSCCRPRHGSSRCAHVARWPLGPGRGTAALLGRTDDAGDNASGRKWRAPSPFFDGSDTAILWWVFRPGGDWDPISRAATHGERRLRAVHHGAASARTWWWRTRRRLPPLST
jgi:hypothetical protein